MLQAAETLVNKQKTEYGEQFAATQQFNDQWDQAETVDNLALKVARAVFAGNNRARGALSLGGERADDLAGWLSQAKGFYHNLLDPQNADLLTAMTEFSYDATKLQAQLDQVTAVEEADLAQEREKGEAQAATKAQNAKLTELRAWMRKHKPIAQVALSDNPQWIEKLGLGSVA